MGARGAGSPLRPAAGPTPAFAMSLKEYRVPRYRYRWVHPTRAMNVPLQTRFHLCRKIFFTRDACRRAITRGRPRATCPLPPPPAPQRSNRDRTRGVPAEIVNDPKVSSKDRQPGPSGHSAVAGIRYHCPGLFRHGCSAGSVLRSFLLSVSLQTVYIKY